MTSRRPRTPDRRLSRGWSGSLRGAVFGVLCLSFPLVALAQSGGGADRPVHFTARDSLVVSLQTDEGDLGRLYGSSVVDYGESKLEAWRVEILFDREELRADGLPSDTGLVGGPIFRQGDETFNGERLAFNLRTERGRVIGARTAIEEGFIRADVVKATEDSTLFIRNGVYTTCPCVDDPSYSLRSSKMKIVNRKWIYTGPIQLYLYNIPTPLWLPFGFLPATEGRRSGPLPPSYGEDEFGFYLRDFGWYFALSDYVDLQLQGSLWTRGSLEVKALSRYRKRYSYDGQLQVSAGRFRSGEKGDPDFSIRKTGSVRWTHRQPISPTANFDANVNLSTSGYLRGVSQDYDDRTRQTIQSSARFSKRWGSRSLTVNASQRQVVESGSVSMTFPSLSFSQNAFKPFQRSERAPGSSERFYEKLTVSYSLSADNRYDFTRRTDEALLAAGDTAAVSLNWIDALLSQSDFERATGKEERFAFRATHRVPISAPFSVNRLPLLGSFRMNLSPSVSYTEDWFVRTERREVVETESGTSVVSRSVPGFFALRQYTASLSASSVFYGIFPLRVGPYSGLRHTVKPSLGFGYRPDFGESRWGYTRAYVVDSTGAEKVYNIVNGVQGGEQQSLTFSLNNTFETRRLPEDSTAAGARSRTVKLLDLNLSSSYNLAADSNGFQTINLTGRTRLFGQVDVDFRSTFSPYRLSETGGDLNEYAFAWSSPLGRLTSANLTIRTSLRSGTQRGAGRPLTTSRAGFAPEGSNPFDAIDPILQQPYGGEGTDFSIPWSLSLDLTYGITRYRGIPDRRAILNTSFDFSLTPNWKITGRSGYDFEQGRVVTTNLAIARDFSCWQMALTWIPFGDYQSWGFDLHVKSGHLRDLLRLRQPKSDVRGRFGSM